MGLFDFLTGGTKPAPLGEAGQGRGGVRKAPDLRPGPYAAASPTIDRATASATLMPSTAAERMPPA